MIFCKSWLKRCFWFLVLSAVVATPLLGEGEASYYFGLWDFDPQRGPEDDPFLYRIVLRYRARASLRAAGLLPEQFRAVEDSLGLISERYDDFLILQDSLALGFLPPTNLPTGGRDLVTRLVSVDLETGEIQESAELRGSLVHPSPRYSQDQYLDRMTKEGFRRLWAEEAQRSLLLIDRSGKARRGLLPELELDVAMPGAVRSIIGKGNPSLQVNGSERISFSGTSRWYPDRPVTEFQRKQSKFPQLDMKQELNLNLTGNIGDKVSVDVDQSSEAATPLANRIKIHYTGYEDEILQRLELGNTSLSLPGTKYVSYSGRHEGLFGINAQALFGDLQVNGILSKQEGKNETRSITKGAELQERVIEDWQYRSGKFFFLVNPDGPGLPVNGIDPSTIEVWIDDRNVNNDINDNAVGAYVTLTGVPESIGDDPRATGSFHQLIPNQDFIIQQDVYLGYPVLILNDRNVMDRRMTKALAVRFEYREGDQAILIGGDIPRDPAQPDDSDSLVLKMIRPANEMGGTNAFDLTQGIFAETRLLELRNIYDLGSNIAQEGLVVRIERKKTSGTSINSDRIDDHTYLEILGLDLFTSVGSGEETRGADSKIDQGRIDYTTGYVMFRELQPFSPTPQDIDRRFIEVRPDTLLGELAAPEIYLRNDWSSGSDIDLVSQYRFVVTARSVAKRISLGFNLLQGSETVTSGGQTLIRDRDYTIDYDTGEIEILDAADVRDTDEIDVSYSYLPFGGGGQKTLIGSGLHYKPPQGKTSVSTTWVYESKGSPGIEGRRPRLGQEPTRTVVGEFATSFKSDSWMLTSIANALPGVSTRAKSNFSIDAGMGMSFPNPNTRGQLYIDDFEGAKDEFLVSMNRLGWRPSGIPLFAVGGTISSSQVERRGELWWYSPRSAVKEGDLQPTHEDSGGLDETEKDNNRQVLELHFFPNGADQEERRESWFSLVQPLSTRGTDLSRAQFLDFWINDYYPLEQLDQREGKLHLEIGVVSENAIWNRVRPEDLTSDSFSPPDFVLNSEDGSTTDPPAPDGQLDDGEDVGLDGLEDVEEGAGPDPALDNWDFTENDEDNDRKSPDEDSGRRERYRYINGTQANGRLDTEDLNGNGILDENEWYFHFVVDLADTSLVEFESSDAPDQDFEYAEFTRGWRRIRVPLAIPDSTVGLANWEQVRHLRLWGEGFSKEEVYLQIGGIDITGNRWLKGFVADTSGVEIPDSLLTLTGEDFFPAVLNNKDNSTAEYYPPFKPRERQNVEEREQALTLEMRNFEAGHVGSVFRTYTQPQDFSNLYRTLEIFLNERIRQGPTPNLEFFLRLSRDAVTDTTNYYEYRVPVSDVWELKQLDLAELSRLQIGDTCRVSTCLITKDLEGGGLIARKGNPNLTSIQRITFGVINLGPTAVVDGSVWVNELRLTGVKRDRGVAGRVAVGLNLADIASVNVNYQRTDADFLSIGQDVGSGRTRTNVSMNSRLDAHRFVPKLGINLPLSYSRSQAKDVPKFRPGSDLVLKEATDRDITETTQEDFSFSLSRARSQNPWLRYTVDAVNLSGRIGITTSRSPLSQLETNNRGGTLTYSVPLQGGPPIRVYRTTEMRLLPTKLSVTLAGTENKVEEYGRRDGDLNREFVRIPRDKTQSGSLNWSTGLRPFEPITYSFDQARDLRLGTASRNLLGFNVGTETSRRHKLSASQQIKFLPKALRIVPKISWNSSFEGAFNAIQTSGAGSRARTNRFNNASSVTVSGSIPIPKLSGLFSAFRSKPTPETSAPDSTGSTEESPPRPTRSRSGGRSRGRGGGFLSIGAIGANFTVGRTSRIDRVTGEPSLDYQLGWARDPGKRVKKELASSSTNGDRKDLNLTTDVKLLGEVSIRTTFAYNQNKSSVSGAVTTNETRRFPDLSINWGRLHQKLGLGKITKELRATSNYRRSTSKTVSGGSRANERIDTKTQLNPLLNLDAKLNNDVSAKLTSSYDSGRNESRSGSITNITLTKRRRVGLTLSRALNLSRLVTNPITKKKSRVTSKLNLSLSMNYGDEKRVTSQGGKSVTASDHVRLDFSTTAGYNFTTSISGNAAISYLQDNDRKNRTNTLRSVSVTLSAAFRF